MRAPFLNILRPACVVLVLVLALAAPASATITTLTFEGLQDLEAIGSYYDGGLGAMGSGPGPGYGVTFSSNALAIIDVDAGGSGNFGGEPSPSTILFFLGGSAATMTYGSGFDTGFSFYYSAINQPGFVNVYDGVNGTGSILAHLDLPLTPFSGDPDPNGQFSPLVPVGVGFAGVAKSIDFGGTINQIGFDNVTFGSQRPTPGVPEPGTLMLIGTGLAGLLALRRRSS